MSAPNGHWSDFISDFMAYTSDTASPEIYRLWSGIAALAGALERRVWVRAYEQRDTFPNLYTLLVGAPGVGKQVIDTVKELWEETLGIDGKPVLHVAPDSVSKASLVDSIGRAKRVFIPPRGATEIYHSLLFAAEEFQFFLPAYDNEFISLLNKIFNNPKSHQEVRRTGSVRELKIELPQLNILAGAQPAYFVSTFPEEAWSTGLARRLIMVYAAEGPAVELFHLGSDRRPQREHLLTRLGQFARMHGQLRWTPEAGGRIADWHRAGGPPAPSHSKLVHYNRSRTMHLLKLCMISAISRTGEMTIEDFDVRRGVEWLLHAERLMPDIFREMIGKSDAQVIEELHYFVQALWAKNRGKAVHSQMIWDFLSRRVPSEKVERILFVAEKANVLARVVGTEDLWLPRPRVDHSVE